MDSDSFREVTQNPPSVVERSISQESKNDFPLVGSADTPTREVEAILRDFEKPLKSYPLIDSSGSEYRSDGLFYRKGIEEPFTGRLEERTENGEIALEASYLEGQPHGVQIRRHDNGQVAMEAIFDHGVLTGLKSCWWPNGRLREEEYWNNGVYKGKRTWDEEGRLSKEERVLP